MNDGEIDDDSVDGIEDLIRYHQREMGSMKLKMEQAKDDHEFEEARAYELEFFRHESRLRFLRDLKDPMFDRRASLYNRLVRLEDRMRENPHIPNFVTQCKLEIKAINDALDEIESPKYAPLETQYIDDALFELVQGSIQGFSIPLNKKEGIVVEFYCREKSLLIHFRYPKGSMDKYGKRSLRRLGFVNTEEKRNFVWEFDVTVFNDAQPVKQLLSAVLFEVLGRGRYDTFTELIIDRGTDGDSVDQI